MTQVVGIEVGKCKNSPWQVRSAHENPAKPEIKVSMKNQGQLTPVKGYWKNGFFLVWSGGTRLECAKELGWLHIDAIVEQPQSVLAELTAVLTANNQSSPHWLGVDAQGEAVSGKAFIISLMVVESSYAEASHRAGVSVQEAIAAYYLCNNAPEAIRFAVASDRLSWTAYNQWLETEVSQQDEIVKRLQNGERVTVSKAKELKVKGKNISRKQAEEHQSSLPFVMGTEHELGPHTNVLIDIRKLMRNIVANKETLVTRDLQLLNDIQGMISTCEEKVGYAQ